jgi:anti-sigma-K factor RskA
MSTHGDSDGDSDMMAAEYVMDLLDDVGRREAEQRMASDAAFAASVDGWRKRFAEFDATAEPVQPSEHLWSRIADSIGQNSDATPSVTRHAATGARIWDSLRFWRAVGLAGGLAAAVLAAVAVDAVTTSKQLRRDLVELAQSKPVYVAILVNDTTHEVGAVVNTFANGRVELVPLKAIDVPAGRTLQVWTLWDRAVGPKSVGIMARARTVPLNLESLPAPAANQLFEITLEPEGGSPIGRPTGPILFKGNAARAL